MSAGTRPEARDADPLAMPLRFLRAGTGGALPVVLIHGFPFDARMWRPQLEAFAGEHDVVAPHLRGFGGTSPGDGQTTMELLVDDLFAFLDRLALDPAVLVGLSMGGYVALRAAEREPRRLRGLVLCDTRSEADSDEGRLGRARTLRRVKEGGTGFLAEEMPPRLLSARTLESRPAVVAAVREMIADAGPTAVCGALLAMAGRTSTTAMLAELEVPALVVAGEEDRLTPPELGREMAGRIPDATVHVVPEAGHVSNLENPEAFDRGLRGFLESL